MTRNHRSSKFVFRATVLLLFTAALMHATGAIAGPTKAPPKLNLCVGCHGKDGISTSDEWPNLAAQNARYLADQSIEYRDKLRADPNGLMRPWVQNLTDKEINEIAAYYSAQPPADPKTPAKGDLDKGKKVAILCAGCHGTDGTSVNDEWPNLAAQNEAYLQGTTLEYKQGKRQDRTGIMASFAQSISEEEIEAVAAYYSSQSPKGGEHE